LKVRASIAIETGIYGDSIQQLDIYTALDPKRGVRVVDDFVTKPG
jgi:hypothetical protein